MRIHHRRFRFSPSAQWALAVGWFGFNVMSAQTLDKISGLVAVNSLMAMVGGTPVAAPCGQERPRLRLQRPAGRPVAVFTLTQNRWKLADALGVWLLRGRNTKVPTCRFTGSARRAEREVSW